MDEVRSARQALSKIIKELILLRSENMMPVSLSSRTMRYRRRHNHTGSIP